MSFPPCLRNFVVTVARGESQIDLKNKILRCRTYPTNAPYTNNELHCQYNHFIYIIQQWRYALLCGLLLSIDFIIYLLLHYSAPVPSKMTKWSMGLTSYHKTVSVCCELTFACFQKFLSLSCAKFHFALNYC